MHFKTNQEYLFEVLSISLGLDNGAGAGYYEMKGLLDDVWIDGGPPQMNRNNWEHQKGLLGEYLQIYTEEGSSKVDWDTQWMKSINKPVTWFQARFDLDHLVKQDLNANPILIDTQGLNRGHIFINGNYIGLYWLIQGVCQNQPSYCQQSQINCLQPTQRYYHIPSDWLKLTNNLITIFDDLGAPTPGSVGLLQHVVTN